MRKCDNTTCERTKIALHTDLICVQRRRKFNLQALGWRSRAIRPYGGETNDTNVKCTRRRSTLGPRRRTISNAAEHSRTMFRLVNKLHASDVRVCSACIHIVCVLLQLAHTVLNMGVFNQPHCSLINCFPLTAAEHIPISLPCQYAAIGLIFSENTPVCLISTGTNSPLN
jgi:hypothetical protein